MKKISAVFTLKDQFSSKINDLSKNGQKAMKNMTKSYNKFKKTSISALKTVGAAMIGFAVGAGFAIKKYLGESLQAYQEQNRAEVMLINTMKRRGITNQKTIKSLLDYGGEMQKVGVVGDEVVQMGMNELAMYGLKADQIKKLTPKMLDMLVKEKGLNATMEDSAAVGKTIAKALAGKTKGLQAYGVYLTDAENKMVKTMNTEQKVAFFSKKIEKSVGGMNKQLLNTPEGALKSLKNTYGDIQEEVGKRLQPTLTTVFGAMAQAFVDIQPRILHVLDQLEQFRPSLEKGLKVGVELVVKSVESLFHALEWVKNNWNWILPTAKALARLVVVMYTLEKILALVTFMQDLNTVASEIWSSAKLYELSLWGYVIAKQRLSNVVTGLSTVATWAQVAATWALNGAIAVLTSPITWVIAAFAALVAIGVVVYKNWDKIKQMAIFLKDKFVELIKKIGEFNIVKVYIAALKWEFNFLKKMVLAVFNAIGNLWTIFTNSSAVRTVISLFEGFKNSLQSVWSWLKNIGTMLSDNFITKGISSVVNWVGDKMKPTKHNALGTSYYSGGLTSINERGGELVDLPNGTRIIPHDLSKKIINNKSNSNITVNLTVQGNMIGNEAYTHEIATAIVKNLALARGNI